MSRTGRRIVFLGTHGQYNIGDELLLDTFLTQLGAQHHYVVNSYDPDFTRAQLAGRFDVTVIDTARERGRLLRELLRCDVVVFGGGSIVKELYASTGRNRYATLVMILTIVTFCRWVARKPVAMLNIGVGPLRTSRGLWLARLVLSQVDLLTVRDAGSVRTGRAVGADPVLVADAVFSVDRDFLLRERAGSGGGATLLEGDTTRLRVALNLNHDIENPDAWEPFLAAMARCLDRLDALHPLELHALPMQAGFKDHHDAEVIESFAARLPGIPFVRHDLASHVDAACVISTSDLVVSERLHAVVMASVLGVPAFVLAYDVKVRELARVLEVEQWCVDINRPLDVDDVVGRMARLLVDRATVSRHLQERRDELHQQAGLDFDAARQWVSSA